ncbi:MAG: recombinase family protein [Rhodopirellula sp.]|nr:recombinase family protein [Rhodopirellula sp.]
MATAILPRLVAVLYLRMSSKKQDVSIPAQRDALIAYAKKHGITILREYVDEGISGDATEKRDGFLRLRQDAEEKRDFSVILVWDEDRFSRNDPLELGYWLKPIRDAGIVVETPKGRVDWETLGGRLVYLISQEMRHEYLRSLSRNATRGLISSAKDVRDDTGGAAPKGYTTADGKVVVDPYWAGVIRRIFADYLKAGASLRSVAAGLNRDGILTTKGKKWSVTTVRYILRNRKYTGAYVRFRFRVGKYNAVQDGEIVPRTKANVWQEVDPTVVEGHHDPIIDQTTFDRAQSKLERQRGDTAPKAGKNRYALSGLLRCGDCGLVMAGAPVRRKQLVYRCHTYQDGGKSACFRNQIPEDRLIAAVARKLHQEYWGENAIERQRKAIRKRQAAEKRRSKPLDETRVRSRIEALDRQIDQGTERVFSAPEGLVARLYAKLDELRTERDQLRSQLDATGRDENGSNGRQEKEVDEAVEALRDLRRALEEADPEDRRDLLRQIISRIELHFSHEDVGGKTKNTFTHGTIFVRPDAVSSILLSTVGS